MSQSRLPAPAVPPNAVVREVKAQLATPSLSAPASGPGSSDVPSGVGRATVAGGAAVDARHRIAQSAFRLFSQRGYSCTSVQDIADDAGVQKSILYYYFASKEALYTTLLQESAARLREILQAAVSQVGVACCAPADTAGNLAAAAAGGAPAGGKRRKREQPEQSGASAPVTLPLSVMLSRFVETLLAAVRDNRDSARFFMAHVLAPDADRPLVGGDDLEQMAPHIMRGLLTLGVQRGELHGEPELAERLLLGAVQYSVTRHLRSPEQEPLTVGLGQRIVDALLRCFGATPAHSPSPVSVAKAPDRAAPQRTAKLKRASDRAQSPAQPHLPGPKSPAVDGAGQDLGSRPRKSRNLRQPAGRRSFPTT